VRLFRGQPAYIQKSRQKDGKKSSIKFIKTTPEFMSNSIIVEELLLNAQMEVFKHGHPLLSKLETCMLG